MSEQNTPAAESAAPANEPASASQAEAPANVGAENRAETPASAPEGVASETGSDAETKREEREAKQAAYWRRQAERAQRQTDQLLQKVLNGDTPNRPAAQAETQRGEPRQEQFQTYEAYIDARTEWRVQQEISKRDQTATQAKQTEQSAQRRAALEADLKKSEASIPDIREVVEMVTSDNSFPISPAMADAIMESDKAAALLYWLGKNPDRAASIYRLSPFSAARELGRIEATLSTPARLTATQAPPPPTTLRGGDVPSKDPTKMSESEYVKWRKAGNGGGKAA